MYICMYIYIYIYIYDTCAWTPNIIFLQSYEGSDGKSWNAGYWQLGYASLGKSRQV